MKRLSFLLLAALATNTFADDKQNGTPVQKLDTASAILSLLSSMDFASIDAPSPGADLKTTAKQSGSVALSSGRHQKILIPPKIPLSNLQTVSNGTHWFSDLPIDRLSQQLKDRSWWLGSPPTEEDFLQTTVDLPDPVPNPEILQRLQHIVLYDQTGEGYLAHWHEPLWEHQALLLRRELLDLGVDISQVHFVPVKKGTDAYEAIKSISGRKRAYFFGHSSPLAIHFGWTVIPLEAFSSELIHLEIIEIANYGCSFIRGLATSQRARALVDEYASAGLTLTLWGHEYSSTKTDDSPRHRWNPIVAVSLTEEALRGAISSTPSMFRTRLSHSKIMIVDDRTLSPTPALTISRADASLFNDDTRRQLMKQIDPKLIELLKAYIADHLNTTTPPQETGTTSENG